MNARFFEMPIVIVFAMAVVISSGCGGVKPVVGGTPGRISTTSSLVGDVQITVYRVDGGGVQPIGFAVTAADGSFQLLKNGATGALWLTPGEYVCTLETAGTPVKIPQEYARPETTPLKVSWSVDDLSLDLALPLPLRN